jgi:hypothetical protein
MILIILSLLFFKHWVFDFLWQTDSELANKGTYGNFKGFKHSLKHGLGTALVFLPFSPYWAAIAFCDMYTHYHIDWIKMNYGNQDIKTKKFWRDLGLDQLVHSLVYIGLVFLYLHLNRY